MKKNKLILSLVSIVFMLLFIIGGISYFKGKSYINDYYKEAYDCKQSEKTCKSVNESLKKQNIEPTDDCNNDCENIKDKYTSWNKNKNYKAYGIFSIIFLLVSIACAAILKFKYKAFKKKVSVPDKIKEYKELFDSGAITEEEFTQMKEKLLKEEEK